MHATPSLDAAEVAEFLQRNPEFFDTHAEVFANLLVPHPYASRTISLGERQVLTLRERANVLERQLATLKYNAQDNQRIITATHEWSLQLLSAKDSLDLPRLVTEGLEKTFNVPEARLRLWHAELDTEPTWSQGVSDEIITYTEGLSTPYCGPNPEVSVTPWFTQPPASMALLPLRTAQRGRTFGLLALGSPDPERFRGDMNTDFLQQIGNLAAAALSRLL